MTERALHLAAYDITDDRRRIATLDVLRGWAVGGQRSAYEVYLSDVEREALLESIRSVSLADDERFALIRLDPRGKVYTLGLGVPPPKGRYFYIG